MDVFLCLFTYLKIKNGWKIKLKEKVMEENKNKIGSKITIIVFIDNNYISRRNILFSNRFD